MAAAAETPVRGTVRWAPAKSLWIGGMAAGAGLAPFCASWDAAILFLATTAVTLCFGHSVGMDRRLIHRSFACPLWLERLSVYLGTLVGMAGPIGMVRQHDLRDWAQRQADCHDYLRHRRGFWQDAGGSSIASWRSTIRRPSRPSLRSRATASMRSSNAPGWRSNCLRIAVSVTGHWLVGHFAHRRGGQHWIVEGTAAQGYDIAVAGLISMGESWHNNHHAFPGSAKALPRPGRSRLVADQDIRSARPRTGHQAAQRPPCKT
ncbi:MAG: acyl-CoA desaturase [Reyranella sp.]|uniref:acyl-CoA desaturase n=1 Tax=Reyranella sp. TaxID=1929291 RepID=UPI001AC36674|nr:acyl-CoA desaturase [Reyranella sp.]MBN9088173.1 acyl-CoA desaturase [Reyranella sp.]